MQTLALHQAVNWNRINWSILFLIHNEILWLTKLNCGDIDELFVYFFLVRWLIFHVYGVQLNNLLSKYLGVT